jgi:hypothetical protein
VFAQLPGANVGQVKPDVRMPRPRQTQHLAGQIHTLGFEPALNEQIYNPAAAATSNVKRSAPANRELNRPLVLRDPIPAIKLRATPTRCEAVIACGDLLGLH